MKAIIKEPLFHFTLIGCGLFLLYGVLNRDSSAVSLTQPVEIRITEGDVRWLSETWSRQRQRTPTPEEMSGLVTDLVKEQLLAREAVELGLDENDTIIRRRLAQKVEFLVRDTAYLAEPDDDEMHEFYLAHPDRYRSAGRVSFTHLLFNREQRENASADANAALSLLEENPGAAASLGDRSLMGSEFLDVDVRTVESVFGPGFAEALMQAEAGGWTGPIESAYGVHLVLISDREPPAVRGFEQVRDLVRNDWQSEQQRKAEQAYFEALLEKYDVVIEDPVRADVGPLRIGKGERI